MNCAGRRVTNPSIASNCGEEDTIEAMSQRTYQRAGAPFSARAGPPRPETRKDENYGAVPGGTAFSLRPAITPTPRILTPDNMAEPGFRPSIAILT
jgi:hypothetical protein